MADEQLFKARPSLRFIRACRGAAPRTETRCAQGTLSGWSGDVPQRKRVVARLDAFRSLVSELKDKAPRE